MNWKEQQELKDKKVQEEILRVGRMPKHIAIIMDGNGRWATLRKRPRIFGHEEGIESVRDIVKASSQLGIKYLTLYAFSNENWKRPVAEVSGLMKLLEFYLKREIDELDENDVRMKTIGKTSALPKSVQNLLMDSIERTKDNTGLTLTLALSYSGRWDIVRAVQMIGLDIRRGKLSPEDITEENFGRYLQTYDLPDPDYMIRTSGELRLSNFLLWEMAYGEMYMTDKFWPEFRRADLYEALLEYATRERRFGKTSSQLKEDDTINDKKSYINRVIDAIKSVK